MSTIRKVITIARHGSTPLNEHGHSMDSLVDKSVQTMYAQSRGFEAEIGAGYKPADILALHSDKRRTWATAATRVAGIRGITPEPKTQADLEGLQYDGVSFVQDPRLSYVDLKSNEPELNRLKLPAYLEWQIKNRCFAYMDGVPITSFQELYDGRKGILAHALRELDLPNRNLVIVSTHAVLSDAIAMAAADSARKPFDYVGSDGIGGQFEKEDVIHLVVDTNDASGSVSQAKLVRKGQTFPVDIARIRAYK